MSFKTIGNTSPKLVLNVSKVKDPQVQEVLMAMLRLMQEMQTQISQVVNNNAVQGQGSVQAQFTNLAGVGSRTVVADVNGKLSAP